MAVSVKLEITRGSLNLLFNFVILHFFVRYCQVCRDSNRDATIAACCAASELHTMFYYCPFISLALSRSSPWGGRTGFESSLLQVPRGSLQPERHLPDWSHAHNRAEPRPSRLPKVSKCRLGKWGFRWERHLFVSMMASIEWSWVGERGRFVSSLIG